MSYVRGSKVVVWADLTDNETGQPRTADELIVTVVDGAGVASQYTLAAGEVIQDPDRTNHYTALVDTSPAAGTWQYQFEVPGDEAVLERRQFSVKERLPAVP